MLLGWHLWLFWHLHAVSLHLLRTVFAWPSCTYLTNITSFFLTATVTDFNSDYSNIRTLFYFLNALLSKFDRWCFAFAQCWSDMCRWYPTEWQGRSFYFCSSINTGNLLSAISSFAIQYTIRSSTVWVVCLRFCFFQCFYKTFTVWSNTASPWSICMAFLCNFLIGCAACGEGIIFSHTSHINIQYVSLTHHVLLFPSCEAISVGD